MDVRHLRYFVAVAEALHFGCAARQLNMSQPPLSKRVAELEAALGVILFNRTSRQVVLTASGKRLLPKAKAAVRAFDAAVGSVRTAPRGRRRCLRVAFPPDTSRQVLAHLVGNMRKAQIDTDVTEATTADQQQMLAADELDVGVLRHPFDARGLCLSDPMYQTLGVVLSRTHPLASASVLRLCDLQPYPFVMFPRSMAPGLYDTLLDDARRGSFSPQRIDHAVRMTGAIVVTSRAVTLSTSAGFRTPGLPGADPELIWRPLAGEPLHWWTSVVHRTSNHDPFTRRAVDVIRDALVRYDCWKFANKDVARPRFVVKRQSGQGARSR